jgi:hypothetical protein
VTIADRRGARPGGCDRWLTWKAKLAAGDGDRLSNRAELRSRNPGTLPIGHEPPSREAGDYDEQDLERQSY